MGVDPAHPPTKMTPLTWLGRRIHRVCCIFLPRWRALLVRLFLGLNVSKLGFHVKFRGLAHCRFGRNLRIGDFCWIEAVVSYAGISYASELVIGDDVAISDLTHISCAQQIVIGDGCLLGSKIYVGDHTHGPVDRFTTAEVAKRPALRALANAQAIHIGMNCWIGDGAIILGGTDLAAGSIVAANSVVRLKCDRPALLAGVPARIVRFLDSPAQ